MNENGNKNFTNNTSEENQVKAKNKRSSKLASVFNFFCCVAFNITFYYLLQFRKHILELFENTSLELPVPTKIAIKILITLNYWMIGAVLFAGLIVLILEFVSEKILLKSWIYQIVGIVLFLIITFVLGSIILSYYYMQQAM